MILKLFNNWDMTAKESKRNPDRMCSNCLSFLQVKGIVKLIKCARVIEDTNFYTVYDVDVSKLCV